MKKVKYIRVSSYGQNEARQKEEGIELIVEKCSGSVSFRDRKEAIKLLGRIEKGEIDQVEVHSIDRLGRSTLDILSTIKFFTDHSVNLVSKKEGIQTLIDGKENPSAKLLLAVLASISEMELDRIKERQKEGIAKAKARGVYKANGGNRSKESIEEFLRKSKNKDCLRYFKQGESVRRAAKLSGVSLGTAQKVKNVAREIELFI